MGPAPVVASLSSDSAARTVGLGVRRPFFGLGRGKISNLIIAEDYISIQRFSSPASHRCCSTWYTVYAKEAKLQSECRNDMCGDWRHAPYGGCQLGHVTQPSGRDRNTWREVRSACVLYAAVQQEGRHARPMRAAELQNRRNGSLEHSEIQMLRKRLRSRFVRGGIPPRKACAERPGRFVGGLASTCRDLFSRAGRQGSWQQCGRIGRITGVEPCANERHIGLEAESVSRGRASREGVYIVAASEARE